MATIETLNVRRDRGDDAIDRTIAEGREAVRVSREKREAQRVTRARASETVARIRARLRHVR